MNDDLVELVTVTEAQNEKMQLLKCEYEGLAREFTKILNERGISGSVLEFSVYDEPLDETLRLLGNQDPETAAGRVGLGVWTCQRSCVCGGLVARF